MPEILRKISLRQRQIVGNYIRELDLHIEDVKSGRAERTFEIRDFASILNIHPRHLSNTIYQVIGKSPCSLFEERLMNISRELLQDSSLTIADVAHRLVFDPSNFTKFFKRYTGKTPRQFRLDLAEKPE